MKTTARLKEQERNGPDAKIFIDKASETPITPNDLFRQYEQRHPDLWSTVPVNGESVEISIPIEVLQERLQVKTTEGMRDVKTIRTQSSLTRTVEKRPLSRMFEYSDDHHPRVQGIEAESSDFVMSLHKDLESRPHRGKRHRYGCQLIDPGESKRHHTHTSEHRFSIRADQ